MGQSWTNRVHRVMLLCAVNLSLYLNCYAGVDQGGKKVTLNVVNESCVRVFKQIERQTKMSFFYSTSDISLPEKITLKAVEKPLDEVMGLILDGTGLEWVYTDNVITVRKKKERGGLVGSIGDSSITTMAVSGKVTDANGEAIPGATVRIKRNNDGATTDSEGNFSISNTVKNDVLVISYIGYETRELNVKGKVLLVKLNLAISSLDETVVVAYGKTTKRLNTGNITTVRAEDIEKAPVSNVLSAIQGRMPGVVITQEQGTPGGRFNIRIRGRNSINPSGNEPFYVVDGVPFTSTMIDGLYGPSIGVGNPLNYINPNEIESIDILKDADATAIYGSRGANGVVLITTKRGKSDNLRFNINAQHGIGKVTKLISPLDTREYLEMRREAFKNDGELSYLDEPAFNVYYPDLKVWDQNRYTNWPKLLIGGTAQYTNVQASVSGGSSSVQYLIGTGYNRQSTVFPGDGANRKGSLHLNLSSTSKNKKLKININTNYMADDNNLVNEDFTRYIFLPPNAPKLFNDDGTINWEPYSTSKSTWDNPYSALLRKYNSKTNNLISSLLISYNILKSLEFRTSLGYTNMQQRQIQTSPIASFNPILNVATGIAQFSNSTGSSWNIEPQLFFKKRIEKGELELLVGTTIQRTTAKGQVLNALGYTNDALLEDINSAPNIIPLGSTNSGYKYSSAFGRANFNYNYKYILNLSVRRDGSNKFGPGKRFGNFGAVGVAWLFSNESFIAGKFPLLSYGKLRFSYGKTGNDQIQEYKYINTYSTLGTNNNTLPYQGVVGIGPDNLLNPDYVWEVNKKFEGGLELGFLNDRILTTVSYYNNRSSNQLINYTLPSFVGFTSVTGNLPALIQNDGWELTLSSAILKRRDFTWSANFNLTIPRNKLLEFPDLENSSYANDYIIGQPLEIIRAYKYAGVDPESGVYLFFDTDGKKVTDPGTDFKNRTIAINKAPTIYGGLTNNISYKGFALDILLQFVKQKGQNFEYGGINADPGFMTNQPKSVLSRWRQAGDISRIQKFSQNYSLFQSNDYARNSDFSYVDASFIRLKNISLSYDLSFLKRAALHNIKISIQGQNLLTLTKYKGIDPENQSLTVLPPLKVLTFGLQASF